MQLALQTRGSYQEVLRAARFAEGRGLAALGLPDHYLAGRGEDRIKSPASDALIQLAGLARDTQKIELVVLVSPITFRHPAVYLKQAVDIDLMSEGRFSLGLGAGWFDEEHEVFGIPYPDTTERFERLEEALAYLAAALGEEPSPFQGQYYQLDEFDINPKPTGRLPIVVGGSGPVKTPRLAGLYADEFNVYAQPIEKMKERIDRARSVAAAAGRDPDSILISTACVSVAATDEEWYQRSLASAAKRFDRDPAHIERKWPEFGYPVGTSENVQERLAQWEEIGVQRYYVQGLDATDLEAMDDAFAALGV